MMRIVLIFNWLALASALLFSSPIRKFQPLYPRHSRRRALLRAVVTAASESPVTVDAEWTDLESRRLREARKLLLVAVESAETAKQSLLPLQQQQQQQQQQQEGEGGAAAGESERLRAARLRLSEVKELPLENVASSWEPQPPSAIVAAPQPTRAPDLRERLVDAGRRAVLPLSLPVIHFHHYLGLAIGTVAPVVAVCSAKQPA